MFFVFVSYIGSFFSLKVTSNGTTRQQSNCQTISFVTEGMGEKSKVVAKTILYKCRLSSRTLDYRPTQWPVEVRRCNSSHL